jgi:hypothetical protein
MDQCINLARLAINATITSYSATVMRKSIKPRPSPRPLCATLSSLTVVDVVDANRSTSNTISKDDAHMGKNDAALHHRPIWQN